MIVPALLRHCDIPITICIRRMSWRSHIDRYFIVWIVVYIWDCKYYECLKHLFFLVSLLVKLRRRDCAVLLDFWGISLSDGHHPIWVRHWVDLILIGTLTNVSGSVFIFEWMTDIPAALPPTEEKRQALFLCTQRSAFYLILCIDFLQSVQRWWICCYASRRWIFSLRIKIHEPWDDMVEILM